MASIAISASIHSACCCSSSHHATKKHQPPSAHARPKTHSLASKQATHVTTVTVDGSQKGSSPAAAMAEQPASHFVVPKVDDDTGKDAEGHGSEANAESGRLKFVDERWKKGTWDLNMFVDDGKMDWDGLITAEAKRRKHLELFPEATRNEEPVVFRSSIIPWWAWLKRSYLPEAELLNGRAAMIGFFTAYAVDGLTGMGLVGQTGNWVCKTALLVTIVGVILLRRSGDLVKLRKLADEATFYDKQWRASWEQEEEKI
ncbi:unnamed protein product [Linum tenue]|uniref:Uncharacterized protein n=1 Tax=Linum tenue TaxID=586396 RepID=A0AAV0K5S9_9ROSI|nr:unnamed protein product [Linum tenue]